MNIRQNSQNIHFIAMLLILTFFFYGCSNTQEENQTYQNNSENNLNTDTVPPKSASIKRIWGGVENSFISICYHGVSDNQDIITSISPQSFGEQVKILKENNFKSISFDEVTNFLNGKITLPEKSILITFDDGEESIYENAMPILMKYGYIGNLFLVLDRIDRKGYLSQKQIKELINKGFGIGSHSVSHADIKNLNDIKLKYEVKGSKNKLEALLDVNVDYFAYPYGASYNQKRIKDIILDSGYRGAFTTFIGVNDKITNPVFMFRYMVDYTDKSGEQNKYIKALVTNETEIIKFLHRKKINIYLDDRWLSLFGAEIEAQNLLKIDPNNSFAKSKLRLVNDLRRDKSGNF